MKIDVKCNAFDENEDKQRQCYKQLKCFWPKCRYSCKNISDLNENISHHLNKKSFVCEKCDKDFHHISGLRNHKRFFHSNERHFVCPQNYCNKRFKTKFHLTRHKFTHISVNSFGCDECDKRFKMNSDLSFHKMVVHSHIRPFVCQRSDCNKSFRTKLNLIRHIKTHSSVRNFKCDKCDKKFKTREQLLDHKSVHSSLRPFVYPKSDCNKRFKTKRHLNRHNKKHSSERYL